ncbi:MAG: PAS domain S-box protein [Alphaproteobacteria bacterium]|nr:PAS domain S-box protein [Alphaproteobacteria bacterium]
MGHQFPPPKKSAKAGSAPADHGPSFDRADLFASIVDYTADAIIAINEACEVEYLNRAAERLFGYGREEVLGHNINMLMSKPHQERHDDYVATYLRTGAKVILDTWRETEGRKKDGTIFPIELGVRECWVADRRIFTGIVRDLTALKKAQEEVARKNADIRELSTPVINVADGVLVLPLIGTVDSARARDSMEMAITRMAQDKAAVLIVDITGVPAFDTMVANHIISMATCIRLMGGHSILTGISPATALTIVGLGVDLSMLSTRATLAQGLELAVDLVRNGTTG